MIYIYDILLNYIDSNRVYEFFEWDKNDTFDHIKRIPLFLVEDKVLGDFLNKKVSIDEKFLKTIKNKTLVFTNYNDKVLEYAFLCTNGSKCYAFETDSKGNIIYYSSLLLDEEEDVVDNSIGMELSKIDYRVISDKDNNNRFTRSEQKKINFIEKDLLYTYNTKNYIKLKYLYTECFGNDKTSYKTKYNRLISVINEDDSFYRNKLNFILRLSHDNIRKDKKCV